MPNKVHVPKCPFYKDEQKKTITCEDTYRAYDSLGRKWSWMRMYCDSWDWMKCPYAMDLNEAYEQLEKGDDKALEKNEKEAMKREMKSLSIKMGKAEKRIERMQKRIDELRAVNQSLVNVNESLNSKNRRIHKKWRELSDKMQDYEDTVAHQVMQISDAYEARLAFLMDKFTDGILYEGEVNAWMKDKEFAIIYTYDGDDEYKQPCFKVVFKEEGDDDGNDNNVQTDV